jgi:hypothetical protein
MKKRAATRIVQTPKKPARPTPPGGPDSFLKRVLMFVDRNGKVKAKDSGPMHSALTMSYDQGDLSIKMHATSYAQGNGSCGAMVTYKGGRVFTAAGSFTTAPFDTKITTYKPGPWEKLIARHLRVV